MNNPRASTLGATFTFLLLATCAEPGEAPRVHLPVLVEGSGIVPVSTDLGYEVELTSARLVLRDLVFTVAGEVHGASAWNTMSQMLLARAHAHPGHYQGGEVIGELRGEFVVDWLRKDGESIGVATLIAAEYDAANFTFGHASPDRLDVGDPLIGHTALLTGTARRGGGTTSFTILLDAPPGRTLVGAPFKATIDAHSGGSLSLELHTVDAIEGDTLFDSIDFAALDADADGHITLSAETTETEDAYYTFRRVFLTHDHYSITHRN